MDFSNVKDWTIPEGSVFKVTDSIGRVIWEQDVPLKDDYFFIENISENENKISFRKGLTGAQAIDIYYSRDQVNWQLLGTTDDSANPPTVTLNANERMFFKATASYWGDVSSNIYYDYISSTYEFNAGGNIMSLLYGDDFKDKYLAERATFHSMFIGSKIVSASKLALPENTRTKCYYNMFKDSTSLIKAPVLPSSYVSDNAYWQMFKGCTSLNRIISYAKNAVSGNSFKDWVDGVSATGDFYNLGGYQYFPSGASGIPSGWTVHTSL